MIEHTLTPSISTSPFPKLQEVRNRYRRTVHQVFPPTDINRISQVEVRLGLGLPPDMHTFYQQHNGAILFKGGIHVRSIEELTAASDMYPGVILFAEGPEKKAHWAFIRTENDEFVYGIWDGQNIIAMHVSFTDWLNASISILDERMKEDETIRAYRRRFNPTLSFLLLESIESFIHEGDIDSALAVFSDSFSSFARWPRALVLYAECLRIQGQESGSLYVESLKHLSFPCPYPSFLPLDHDFLFQEDNEAFIHALGSLLEGRVYDIHAREEFSFVVECCYVLAQYKRRKNQRKEAFHFLTQQLKQIASFTYDGDLSSLHYLLGSIAIELGEVESVDNCISILFKASEPHWATFLECKHALSRKEPFAEQILEPFLAQKEAPSRSKALLLQAEASISIEALETASDMLDEAEPLLRNHNDKEGVAELLMLRGDIAQHDPIQPKVGLAQRFYASAFQLAQEQGHELLRCRIWLRQTDLLWLNGEREHARQSYRIIADCFAVMELPVLEAWTRLRLGKSEDFEGVFQARKTFYQYNIASGVMQADFMLKTTANSLSWHLDCCQLYTQLYAKAYKSSPPYLRRDTARFERRISAHQMAVAKSDDDVITHLFQEIVSLERDMRAAPVSSSNHRFSRYVATLSLIVSHRSYHTADQFLNLLSKERPLLSPIRDALSTALVRTRNMILVQGLIKRIEEKTPGVEIAAEVLGLRREKKAVPPLLALINASVSLPTKKAAISALGRIGDKRAIPVLLECLKSSELVEESALSLLLLGEWRGVDEKAQLLVKKGSKSVGILGEIVGRYGGPTYLLILKQALTLSGNQSLGACMGLGYLGDPRVIPELIDMAGSRNPKLSEIASCALEMITGHYETTEEGLLRPRWQTWWDKNSHRFSVGYRYRYGLPMSPKVLIDRMRHDNTLVRRSAYDELVIMTGTFLAFDADGPWRVQQKHLSVWEQWWSKNQKAYPEGRWFFHGKQLD